VTPLGLVRNNPLHERFETQGETNEVSDPIGTRTQVTRMRTWCPRPLDDGAIIYMHKNFNRFEAGRLILSQSSRSGESLKKHKSPKKSQYLGPVGATKYWLLEILLIYTWYC
jgi:hypothetical protein